MFQNYKMGEKWFLICAPMNSIPEDSRNFVIHLNEGVLNKLHSMVFTNLFDSIQPLFSKTLDNISILNYCTLYRKKDNNKKQTFTKK